MALFDPATIARIAGVAVNDNIRSIAESLDLRGTALGLHMPHRYAQYVAQIAHESGRFRYDAEVWGPTAAQRRYDTRTDLGNTLELDGDGYKFRGRAGIQITGRSNYRLFTDWCREEFGESPNFVIEPDLVNTDPWEGMVPLWYWSTNGLNRYADDGDVEMITRRINGGLNGFADRLKLYDRASLVLLGFGPTEVRRFQAVAGITVDGISGKQTRGAMHKQLVALPPFEEPEAEQATPEPDHPDLALPEGNPSAHSDVLLSVLHAIDNSQPISTDLAILAICVLCERTELRASS